jgi:membrane-bound serine protease (ClpP class)
MITIVALIVAGVLLLAIELFVPGGFLGVAGGAFMLGGVAVAFVRFGATAGTVTAVIAAAVLGAAIFVEFKLLPKSRFARAFSMTETVAGAATKPALDAAVGSECVAQTKLRPSGYVAIGAARYEAFCRSGGAEPGERLRVVGVDNFRLIVTQIETPS